MDFSEGQTLDERSEAESRYLIRCHRDARAAELRHEKQGALAQVKLECCDLESLQFDQRCALVSVLHRRVLDSYWKRP